MKNLILVFVLFFSLSSLIPAQDFKLSSINVNLGKGATSSGYDICVTFRDSSNQTFSVIGNHTRMYVAYAWPVANFKLAASGGFYNNMPWIGPKITSDICSFISTMHWLSFGAGLPGDPGTKVQFFFGFNAVYVKLGKFQVTYSLLNWMKEKPQNIPGIFFGNSIGENWSYTVGTEYNLRDHIPLFQFAFKKTF
jgi:hypothetical protein